jgi:DNA repair photolyase
MKIEIKEIEAKSILTNCKIPGIDFTINPYIGCRFGCTYCYASFMGRFIDKKNSDWGNFVYPKINAGQLLSQELARKCKNKGKGKEIFISSVTDPYQGLEAKYQLTRSCLKELVKFDFQGIVSILTKSQLVTRDIDLLKKLKAVVGLTVTSTDDKVSRYFEKYAPNVTDRYKALEKLNKAGVKTYAFLGPLLPHYVANQKEVEKIFKKLSQVGTRDIFIEHLNLSAYIRNRMLKEATETPDEIIKQFYASQSRDYRQELEQMIRRLVKKYKMNLLRDMVIYHKEFQKSLQG